MFRQTGEEDEYDQYEGNDENAHDHFTGERDWDRVLEGIPDSEDSDEPNLCGCTENAVDHCDTCEHALACENRMCDGEEHSLAQQFGWPKTCECAVFEGAGFCIGCGHKEWCFEDRLIDFEARRHSDWVAYMGLGFCDCKKIAKENRCQECSHTHGCENTSFCGSTEFHLTGALEIEAESEMAAASVVKAANSGKHWDVNEDESLIREYFAMGDFADMASEHGRSETAIWMRLVQLSFQDEVAVKSTLKSKKIKFSEWQDGDIEVLRSSYLAGVSVSTLAEVLERNIIDVAKKIVEMGLAKPLIMPAYRKLQNGGRWTTSELTQLMSDFQHKLPIDLMSANAGRSKFSVLSMLYSLGEITDDEVNELIQVASSSTYGN